MNLQYRLGLDEATNYDQQRLCWLLQVKRNSNQTGSHHQRQQQQEITQPGKASSLLLCGLYNSLIKALNASTRRVRSFKLTIQNRFPTETRDDYGILIEIERTETSVLCRPLLRIGEKWCRSSIIGCKFITERQNRYNLWQENQCHLVTLKDRLRSPLSYSCPCFERRASL